MLVIRGAHLPSEMVELLDNGEKEQFDQFIKAGMSDGMRALLEWRMAPYGTRSPFKAFTAARKMSLDTEAIRQIECPTLILDPED